MSSTDVDPRRRRAAKPKPAAPSRQAASGNDRTEGLAEKAYRSIRALILHGELPLGAAIPRRELAARLGVSLQPIADALQRLEFEGLVENVSRVGSRVRVPLPQDIRGLLLLREALETQAARLFALKASPAQKRELLELARVVDAEYEECADSEHTPKRAHAFGQRFLQFHMAIGNGSDCPMLSEALEKNLILMLNCFWVQMSSVFWEHMYTRVRYPKNFHTELAEALCTGDEEEADRAMRRMARHKNQETMECLEPFYRLDPGSIIRHGSSSARGGSGDEPAALTDDPAHRD